MFPLSSGHRLQVAFQDPCFLAQIAQLFLEGGEFGSVEVSSLLNTIFFWLVNAGYLAGNPLSPSHQRARHARLRIIRYLGPDLWPEIKFTIDKVPKETDREREHYFRLRRLFSLRYPCGLRMSEVVGILMAGLFSRRDKDGEKNAGGSRSRARLTRRGSCRPQTN